MAPPYEMRVEYASSDFPVFEQTETNGTFVCSGIRINEGAKIFVPEESAIYAVALWRQVSYGSNPGIVHFCQKVAQSDSLLQHKPCVYTHYSGTSYEFTGEKYEKIDIYQILVGLRELRKEVKELKEEVAEIKETLGYLPDGEKYLESEKRFNEINEKS